jgi:hypothetical protein
MERVIYTEKRDGVVYQLIMIGICHIFEIEYKDIIEEKMDEQSDS